MRLPFFFFDKIYPGELLEIISSFNNSRSVGLDGIHNVSIQIIAVYSGYTLIN